MERKFSKSMSATARALRARLPDAPPVRGLATARAPSLTLTRRAVLGAPRASRSDERSVARSLPPSLPLLAGGATARATARAASSACLSHSHAASGARSTARESQRGASRAHPPSLAGLRSDRPPALCCLTAHLRLSLFPRGEAHPTLAREAARRQHETGAAPPLHLGTKFTARFFGGPLASRG